MGNFKYKKRDAEAVKARANQQQGCAKQGEIAQPCGAVGLNLLEGTAGVAFGANVHQRLMRGRPIHDIGKELEFIAQEAGHLPDANLPVLESGLPVLILLDHLGIELCQLADIKSF